MVLVLAVSALGGFGGCRVGPFDCPNDEDREACETAKFLAFLATLPRVGIPAAPGNSPGSSGPASAESSPVCATSAATAAPLAYVRVGHVPAGASCYYRFEVFFEPGNNGPFSPAYHLISEIGNADLYVGFDNDATGGTTGYTACSSTSSGGGWVRCSRNPGNADDFVSTNATGIPKMSPGDFRIVSVYNAGTSGVDYAVLAYKNGNHPD